MNGGGAAAAAYMIQAIKASGAIVQVEPEVFLRLVQETEEPVVIHSASRFLGERHQYLSSYRGFVLHAKSRDPLRPPGRAKVIEARKIWVP